MLGDVTTWHCSCIRRCVFVFPIFYSAPLAIPVPYV